MTGQLASEVAKLFELSKQVIPDVEFSFGSQGHVCQFSLGSAASVTFSAWEGEWSRIAYSMDSRGKIPSPILEPIEIPIGVPSDIVFIYALLELIQIGLEQLEFENGTIRYKANVRDARRPLHDFPEMDFVSRWKQCVLALFRYAGGAIESEEGNDVSNYADATSIARTVWPWVVDADLKLITFVTNNAG